MTTTANISRLRRLYDEEIVPKLQKQFGLENRLAVPRLEKITVNMGVGRATENKARLEKAAKELALIAGQKPVICRARRSVAGFKVREGNPIGCKVTLRGERMYEFLDRLINIVIPRVRDFRGLSPKAFDGYGNYSMGLTEQIVFPEIDIDSVEGDLQGMNITLTITGNQDDRSFELLRAFGMPFRRN